jgi:hypothetical protein
MPTNRQWSKEVLKDLKKWEKGAKEAAKILAPAVLDAARKDGILFGGTKKIISKKTKKPFLLWIETPDTNRYYQPSSQAIASRARNPEKKSHKPRRIYNQSKYMDRTGELVKALTPTGWSGDVMSTLAHGKNQSNAYIQETEKGLAVRFSFNGNPAGALMGGDSKRGRKRNVVISDENGNPIHVQTGRGRRRIMELAAGKVSRISAKAFKQGMAKAGIK